MTILSVTLHILVTGKKMAQNNKKFCRTANLRNCTSYDCVFGTNVQNDISSNSFHFFRSLTFWVFQSSSINGKEILRCAPPSSHVCNFFLFISSFQCFNGGNYKHFKFSILNHSRCSDAWRRNCGLAHWCHFHRLLCKRFEQYKIVFTLIEVVSWDGFQEISRILIKLAGSKWSETNDCQY